MSLTAPVRLTKEDARKISIFEKENFIDFWNENQLLSSFNSPCFHAYALIDEGKITGLITFHCVLDEGEIYSVVVKKSERGKGLGFYLLDFALDKLAEQNVKKVFLEVRSENEVAIGLYLKAGFEKTAIRKGYYKDSDAVIMKKTL